MEQNCRDAYDVFLAVAKEEMNRLIDEMDYSEIEAAAELILAAQKAGGRVHVSGIGKPGHISGYIASVMSSTGNPTYFLHGTEAVHGSCGQLKAGDVVICISNSGETSELMATAVAIRNNGCKIIAVTGRPESTIAKFSDVHIFAGTKSEGGPLGRAPRTSILAECIALQALSVILQKEKAQTVDEYILRHPGGTLGQTGNKK